MLQNNDMCTAVFALTLLIQDLGSMGSRNPLEVLSQTAEAQKSEQIRQTDEARELRAREQEFVERFNALVTALGKFSKTYKEKHVIDVKTVESIKKAYRNLERADPTFRVSE